MTSERKRLERRIRELERRLVKLASAERPVEKKSWWQGVVQFLAATSVVSAVVTGSVTIVTQDDTRCAYAHEAIRDDSLNQALSPEQQRAYMEDQLLIAQECDRQDR